ncbi:non-ribosomal peptide synthetase [Amycolatopsis sp. CA-128772]|uniref:non-ribosomal peptide synthetase n=1 Tax=Amycolatopsis sp. CA-128772 TaxID=2073159 RepID=UPI000CCFEB28|nr:non-ribosomal peptide synthetase [Amycolatopsis sp. CA-128772]
MHAPLSFAQQRLWFLDQLHPGATGYNIPSAHRVRGPLDPGLLAAALTEVVRRHEVVRSVVAEGPGGQPELRTRPPEPVKLPVTLVDGDTADQRLAKAAELARNHVLRPFDLRHGPLLRAELFRIGDDDHVLLVCLHHLVADQWTLSLLLRELSELYPAFLLGFGSPLPEPAVQYADFTRWQRETLTDAALAPQLRHWRGQLAGFEPLELLTDRPRPPVQGWDGARVRRRIPGRVLGAVREVAARHDVTLFAAVAAGLSAVLARHTGQAEVVFGAAIAHRDRPEFEDLLGFFVNTVVLRTDLAGDPGFGDLLARVQETALRAQENQDLPIERLADLSGPDRDLSRPPLVNVVLSFLNTPADPLRIPGSAVTEFVFDPGVVKFELDFMAFEADGELVVDVDYRRDLFDRDTVEGLLRHLERILEGAAADPATPVSDLAVLSPAEHGQLLAWGNAAEPAEAATTTVTELFAEQVALRPDAPAVRSGTEVLTYAELDARASQVADAVLAHAGGRPLCAGVCLDRSIDQVAALLGILRAGGHYLPLDPGYPADRLGYLLGDAGATVVVTSAAFAGRTASWSGPKVLVEDTPVAATSRAAAAPGPEDLAYVMYTSGSTGRPKGVRVPHRAVVRLVHETDYVRIGPGDRVAHSSSISFDAATFEIWGALLTGAELVILPRETVVEPAALTHELREQGVTVLWMTSSLFNHTVGEVPDAVAGIGTVIVGGEALDPAVIRAVLAAGNAPKRLLNGYGPTENTTFSTAHLITGVPEGAVSVPIGRPIRGTRCYVTGTGLALVPVGVPGELCVAGLGLAHGYVGAPELTAGRFVPDPHGRPGDLLYRTGDLVRWRQDGTLEFLGRRDDQVKVRGYRVEPGEIEARLTGCPGVRAALVLVRPGDDGGRLVAYVVAEGDPAELSTEDIKAQLAGTLPGYMVPGDVVALEAFPLNANGKVDRARLPEPGPAGRGAGYVAPRTELETTVCRVWAELLGAEVGVTGNFFHLGGTSLLATRAVGRLRRELGVRVSVRTLFDHPTAGDFAAAVQGTGETRK